ncbi:MAG: ATPase domain-containing protein [Candidatus Micrarchaeota archaeon]
MKREIVPTGIDGLDAMLNGGLTKGSITTLSGPTGCGKSTLAMQFLINGAEKYNETGLYIVLEETKDRVYSNMAGYTWDITKLERTKKMLFLDYPIHETNQFLSKNSAIEELITTLGVERVVIDSIMPIALLFQNADERQKGFLTLIEYIRAWNATTIIVSEDTPATTQDILPRTKFGIESLADTWLHMYYLYDSGQLRKRALEVLKMKGVQHSTKLVPFEITQDGINTLFVEKEKIKSSKKSAPGEPKNST